jgi:preprotein translocase subunit YajC
MLFLFYALRKQVSDRDKTKKPYQHSDKVCCSGGRMNRLILKRGEQPNKPLNAAHLCFFLFYALRKQVSDRDKTKKPYQHSDKVCCSGGRMNRLILKRGEQPNKPLNAAHLCFFLFYALRKQVSDRDKTKKPYQHSDKVCCSGGRIRTYDLWVMSPTSYLCSTPQCGCKYTTK